MNKCPKDPPHRYIHPSVSDSAAVVVGKATIPGARVFDGNMHDMCINPSLTASQNETYVSAVCVFFVSVLGFIACFTRTLT